MLAKKTFQSKLILSYVAVILVSFGFTAFFLDKNLEENSLQDIKSFLVHQGNLIETQVPAEHFKKEDTAHLYDLVKIFGSKIESRITIVNRQGKVLADSGVAFSDIPQIENHLFRPEINSALAGNIGYNTRYSHTLKINMLYIALPIRDNGEILGALRLALPLKAVQKTLWSVRKTVLWGSFFALGLALILGSIVASQVIGPVNRMIQASRKFASGDFSHKLLRFPKDEIGELADTLNKMAQEIEDKIREIQRQNQHVAAIFNSMIEGVIVVDKATRIVSVNPAVEKIFRVKCREAEGKMFLEAVRNKDIFDVMSEVLKDGKPLSRELSLVLPVQKIFQINASAVFENGSVSGCLVVIHDITEIKKLETMRRDFVANVSHELKTPLTSITGFVETLLEGALSDKENSRHFLEIIYNHTQRLNSLINDLLDLSAIEFKQIELKIENLKIKDLVEKVIFGLDSQIKAKNIVIKNELDDLLARADRNRLEQVFTNLIDNAVKFNKEGGFIKIYTEALEGKTKITVEDSGIGIPHRDLRRIFERFYRVDKARSRELGGTGLGLSIVKHIAELHEGSVGVESTEGIGSKFWFILPNNL